MPTSFSHIVLCLFTFSLLLLQSLQYCYLYLCHFYHYYHTTLLLNTLLQILNYPGVVALTTQLLILKNILWLPLCRINKFGWILYPRKLLRSPILVGYQDLFRAPLPRSIALFFESLGIYICWTLWRTWKMIELLFCPKLRGEVRDYHLALH